MQILKVIRLFVHPLFQVAGILYKKERMLCQIYSKGHLRRALDTLLRNTQDSCDTVLKHICFTVTNGTETVQQFLAMRKVFLCFAEFFRVLDQSEGFHPAGR